MWFNGIQFVEFNSGEICCFVELVKKSKEAYVQQDAHYPMHMIHKDNEEDDKECTGDKDKGEVEVKDFLQMPCMKNVKSHTRR